MYDSSIIPNITLTKDLLPVPTVFISDSLEILVLTWVMLPLMYTTMNPLNWKMRPTPSCFGSHKPLSQHVKKGLTLLVGKIGAAYSEKLDCAIQ